MTIQIENKSIKIAEYIWIDGDMNLRSKSKTIYIDSDQELNFEIWNFDGSSTNQATTQNSEVILNPIAYYKNPFYEKDDSYLVLCDTYKYTKDNKFIKTNTNNRLDAKQIFDKNNLKPWYGLEQEYFIFNENYEPELLKNYDLNKGKFYCGLGNENILHRNLVQKHYIYCINAGLKISGINAEVAPNQWEFQIGPVEGIEAADQLWIARYILIRLAEEFNVYISFKPKPLKDLSINGSGLHTNFSTLDTRKENGIENIYKYIEKLEKKHDEHIKIYGDNSKRLNGNCETSRIETFTSGIGNRQASIRIGYEIEKKKCGYFEDRRPASDADPYQVISKIYETCCLE